MTVTDDGIIDDGIEDETLDDVDNPDGEDDGDDEYVPPSKEDHAAMVAALEKANGEAKARRLELRELRKQVGAPPAGEKPKDGEPVDEARLRLAIESETIGTWKPLVVRSAASAALTAAGVIGSPDRLLKLIDMDDIDVDPKTGDIDGVDDAVADLKRDYPHLFRRKAGARSLDAADRKGASRTSKMTDSQIQAAQLRGEL